MGLYSFFTCKYTCIYAVYTRIHTSYAYHGDTDGLASYIKIALHAYIHTGELHEYIHTYIHTGALHAYIHTYIQGHYMRTYIHKYREELQSQLDQSLRLHITGLRHRKISCIRISGLPHAHLLAHALYMSHILSNPFICGTVHKRVTYT